MNDHTQLPLPEPERITFGYTADQMRDYSAIQNAQFKALNVGLSTVNSEMMAESDALREQVRVLREALDVAVSWLAVDRTPTGWSMDRLRAALEATK